MNPGITGFQQGVGYPGEEPTIIDDMAVVGDTMTQMLGGDPNPYQEGAHGDTIDVREILWPANGLGAWTREGEMRSPLMGPESDAELPPQFDKEAMREAITQRMAEEQVSTDAYQTQAKGK